MLKLLNRLFPFLLVLLMSCSSGKVEPKKVELAQGEVRSEHESKAKNYMIATQGRHSTQAGLEMFRLGGNAVDAAAAISFAISVERPQSTGIGGGGFLLYYHPSMEKPVAFDFREKAPLAAHPRIFLDSKHDVIPGKSLEGIFAVGVPGLVKGVIDVHRRYGRLSLKEVMAPAIKLAKEGFKVYPELARALKAKAEVLSKFSSSAKIFLTPSGQPLQEGDWLIQEDLANTLTAIANEEEDGFYKGFVARGIVKTSERYRGLITQNDLDQYNVKIREPVEGTYKGHKIYSMSPPSSGGIHVIQILNTVENDNLGELGPHHPKTIHLTASAMQQAFADRAQYLGDSDFVKVPVKELTSKEYARSIRAKIPDNKARNKDLVLPGEFEVKKESDETTHFSVMDKDGHTVVSTQTINGWFGSGLVAEGTGIVLNNEMDDFAAKEGASNLFGAIGGDNNLVEAEKRPLSSMSPTIVVKEKEPVLALGTPSGTRILTCVAQTILNYIEHKQTLYESIQLTRYHHQWSPDEIRVGIKGLPSDVAAELISMGHVIKYNNLGCRIQAISREHENGELVLHGVSDTRGQGMAAGK